MSDDRETPWLVAAPSMGLDEVTRASTVALDRVDFDGRAIVQAAWAHRVRVPDAQRGFELPLGLFTVVEASDGSVVRVRATPTLEALSWAGAWALVASVGEALGAARWIPTDAPRATELARRFEGADVGVAARWRNSPWEVDVTLQRVAQAGSGLANALQYAEDAWLVTVSVSDRRVSY